MSLQLGGRHAVARRPTFEWIGKESIRSLLTSSEFLPNTSLGAETADVALAGDTAPVPSLPNQTTHHSRSVPEAATIGERLFDSRVHLKVAVASYAMHLSKADRARLFGELDYLLDVDAWDEADKLPSASSFRQFLKWLVFTRNASWTSLGIDDEGNILVAWIKGDSRMTANFGNRIRWAQKFEADSEVQSVSGDFTLEHFARHSAAFIANIDQ